MNALLCNVSFPYELFDNPYDMSYNVNFRYVKLTFRDAIHGMCDIP